MDKSIVIKCFVTGLIMLFVGLSMVPGIIGERGTQGDADVTLDQIRMDMNECDTLFGDNGITTEFALVHQVEEDGDASNQLVPLVGWNSRDWSLMEVVSTESTSTSYHPSLFVDSGGTVHVAWEDYTSYGGSGSDFNIFYKRKPLGGSWTVTEVVSTESTSTSWSPSLFVDSGGTVHVAWWDLTNYGGSGSDVDIFYKYRLNLPPVFGTPIPANGSTNRPLSFNWSIPISDPEGDLFSWTIQCSNGQSNGGTGAGNGTKSLSLSGLAYSTTYTVWVNATDPSGSNQYTRRWYTFVTKSSLPPVFGSPSPANGSIDQPLSLTWSIPINDPDGDQFSWTIECSNGQTNSGTGATNGTKTLALSGLTYSTTYEVWVNATDPTGSNQYTRA